ncbi:MAG: polysaccharide biosynthesis C-terminal domain-containing protein, partial [Erysipelotrichaceae bacterium]|nr:polysaccharide biosynthesis C-terminal domain-containing protein [Erysipelotrichaceae bacterium]
AYRFDHHSFKFSLTAALELLKKSRHYIVAGIMIVLYGKVTDVLLLGKMVDDTAVGYYGAATMLCNAWPFVLTALIDSANPMIIELHSKDIGMYKKRLRQLYAAVFYISVLAAVAIGLLSDVIINILYGNEYMPASLILKIFSWNTAFSYLGVARTAWMQCENMTKYESLISFFGAFFSIVLNYALIRRFNIAGAAIAAVLTQFLTNYVLLYVIKDTRENARLITDAILLKGVLK